ncbi:hypothetical protein GCM10027169_12830 [Gordonia jinhuaensis]|uniref:Uncharacterized protein n=1 Tax=Gordonia jinhuaensis TaxID=1517702 RepID=A0A916SXX1_9ACTN|nr:hypothetical protein [Gordonia jinhuaensis]GGB22359.1 hypothetical protein GCM10011489_08170 [Gordonia jinhuaensis]
MNTYDVICGIAATGALAGLTLLGWLCPDDSDDLDRTPLGVLERRDEEEF